MRINLPIDPGNDVQGKIWTILKSGIYTKGNEMLIAFRPVEYTVSKYIVGPVVTAAAFPTPAAIQHFIILSC